MKNMYGSSKIQIFTNHSTCVFCTRRAINSISTCAKLSQNYPHGKIVSELLALIKNPHFLYIEQMLRIQSSYVKCLVYFHKQFINALQ